MVRRENRFASAALLGAGCAVALTGTATAATTADIQPPYPGEDSIEEILTNVYGRSFSQSGNDFTADGIDALVLPDSDDQVWGDLTFDGFARALFADFEQSFGYIPGESGGSFNELFSVGGYGYNVSGSTSTTLTGPFRFARNAEGIVASSRPEDNVDGEDHVITYQLSGDDVVGNIWVLFFEDLPQSVSDWDYQDLVVEIREEGAFIIPSPAALGAGVVMIGGMLLRRRTA